MSKNPRSAKTEGACSDALRPKYAASSQLLHHLDAAGHQREHGGAVLRRDRMHAPIGPIVHIAGEHLARLIEIRTFDYEDQFIADVLMTRQLRAGIEARQRCATLGLLVLPNRFLPHSR